MDDVGETVDISETNKTEEAKKLDAFKSQEMLTPTKAREHLAGKAATSVQHWNQ